MPNSRGHNAKMLQSVQGALEDMGLPQDQIDKAMTTARQKMLADMAEWEARHEIQFIRRTEAKLDNAKVQLAQVERALVRGQVNAVEAIERVIVIQQGVEF